MLNKMALMTLLLSGICAAPALAAGSFAVDTIHPNALLLHTGTVSGNGGSPVFGDSTLIVLRGAESTENRWHAWARFNTAAIPDTHRVVGVVLGCYIDSVLGGRCDVAYRGVLHDPARPGQLPQIIFDDIAAGRTYGSNSITASGWLVGLLNDSARQDLQDSLARGWFAVGFFCSGDSDQRQAFIRGWDGDTWRPYLIVTHVADTHDVGATVIVAPTGTVDSGAVVTPACSVYNYGNVAETYVVRMKIGEDYDETTTINSHAPGDTVAAIFPNWTAGPRGDYAVTCTTELANDRDATNNRRIGSVTVRVRDVGATQVVAPASAEDSGAVIAPACSLYNYGTTTEGYTVRMKIGVDGGLYSHTATVNGHEPGTRQYIAFLPDWIASPGGVHVVSCSTELVTDLQHDNDKVTGSVSVGTHDVGATAITAPTGTVDSGAVVTPACSVYNYGNVAETYVVRMKIGEDYDETTTINSHAPGDTAATIFPNWTAGPRGDYAVTCTTELANDRDPDNDSRTGSATVQVRDVGVVAIPCPPANAEPGNYYPACSLYNYGTTTETYALRMVISDDYDATVTVTDHRPGGIKYTFDRTWFATRGPHPMSACCFFPGDMNPTNDTAFATTDVTFNDVACLEIRTPAGMVDSGDFVRPEVRVGNLGNRQAGGMAKLVLESGGRTMATVERTFLLDVGRTDTLLDFDTTWTARPGSFGVSCTLSIDNDHDKTNNYLGRQVFVPGSPGVELWSPPDDAIIQRSGDSLVLQWNKTQVVVGKQMILEVWYGDTVESRSRKLREQVDTTRFVLQELGTRDYGNYFWRVGLQYPDTTVWSWCDTDTSTFFRFWLDSTTTDTAVSEFFGFPNPFSLDEGTVLRFLALRPLDKASIEVFNLGGDRVWNWSETDIGAGVVHVNWDGTGRLGEYLASGVYLARLTAESGNLKTARLMTKVAIRPRPGAGRGGGL